jgi:hypothetical protein
MPGFGRAFAFLRASQQRTESGPGCVFNRRLGYRHAQEEYLIRTPI